MMSRALKEAIGQVSCYIVADAGNVTDEELAELCVDASRLEIHGYKDEQAEASKLIGEVGYDVFLKEAAKYVYS